MSAVTTTNGEVFTQIQHVELARLIYLRWGQDLDAATCAWKRLFQNSCTESDFSALLYYPEHTESCSGWCNTNPYDDEYQHPTKESCE